MKFVTHPLRAFLEMLFPHRPDAQTVASLEQDTLQHLMHERDARGVVSLLPFADERVRACIHEVKYHENERAAALLGSVLSAHIDTLPATEVVCIPIPLSITRRAQRGHNQCTLIARHAAKRSTATVVSSVLIRTRDTKTQTALNGRERHKNVAGAFALTGARRAQKAVRGKHVILLDDVTTTACPDEPTLAAYVDGRLAPDELKRVWSHVVECERCYETVAAAVRFLSGARRVEDIAPQWALLPAMLTATVTPVTNGGMCAPTSRSQR